MSRAALAIAGREFRAYWDSPIAYVFLAIFSGVTASVFFDGGLGFPGFFARQIADLRPLFVALPMLFLVLVPLITMRLWAEERRTGTEELLLTFPIRVRDAVVGKFLAAWALLSTALALTLLITFTVAWLASIPGSSLDLGPVLGGYVAALLMGGAYLAIGLFVSAITQHQIIAAVVSVFVLLLLFYIGDPEFLAALPEWLRAPCEAISTLPRFKGVSRGVLDLRDVAYYLSMMVVFLSANGVVVDSRRWR
ncbi:MAG: ABC transporter permease [Planctomycetes bacterium]|nr:ABC transporter permease [Planctomycetota bacterium]